MVVINAGGRSESSSHLITELGLTQLAGNNDRIGLKCRRLYSCLFLTTELTPDGKILTMASKTIRM
jgi:hypothetical protein